MISLAHELFMSEYYSLTLSFAIVSPDRPLPNTNIVIDKTANISTR